MNQKDEIMVYLETEATTITALLDEIEYGDNDSKDFIFALRQVSARMRFLSKILDNNCSLVLK